MQINNRLNSNSHHRNIVFYFSLFNLLLAVPVTSLFAQKANFELAEKSLDRLVLTIRQYYKLP
ncbi:hypothetical protein IIC38_09480 [candidate division KSB1 bacterium]|nr:hypothetical protein [candidate division KSB1 bacterium]